MQKSGIINTLLDRALDLISARDLSDRAIDFFREESRHLRTHLEEQIVTSVTKPTSDLLRTNRLVLNLHRDRDDVQAAHGAIKVHSRWFETEDLGDY